MAPDALSFEIGLPPRWQQIDLLAEPGETLLPPEISGALSEISSPARPGRLLLARALVATAADALPVTAGLAISLAHVDSEPSADDGSFGDAEVAAVQLPAGAGLRVQTCAPKQVVPGLTAASFLSVKYLVVTELGLLILAFTTAQGSPSEEWEQLFAAIAATARFVVEPVR
jgi:hypothetical protein